MDEYVKKLVDELNTTNVNSLELNLLGNLYDVLKFGSWEYDDLLAVAQKHIDLLSQFPDKMIRDRLNLNFVQAYANYQHDLSALSFQPLIDCLDKTEDLAFISMVLYFLGGTANKKYLPIVKKYLNHPNQHIQERAKESCKWLKY